MAYVVPARRGVPAPGVAPRIGSTLVSRRGPHLHPIPGELAVARPTALTVSSRFPFVYIPDDFPPLVRHVDCVNYHEPESRFADALKKPSIDQTEKLCTKTSVKTTYVLADEEQFREAEELEELEEIPSYEIPQGRGRSDILRGGMFKGKLISYDSQL